MRTLRAAIVLPACVALVAAGGCVSDRVAPSQVNDSTLDKARGPEQNAQLYTDLIQQLIDENRLYAALAHLQAREKKFGNSDELRLLRADIQRKMDHTASAQTIYKQLLDTQYAGQANHGLGLIYAPQNLAQGTTYLKRAVDQVPTNAQMRNDLGYALLRQGKIADARLQLATAYQLDEGNELNRNNYILLLLMQGRKREAERIAADSQVSREVMQNLQARARRLSGGRARASGTRGSDAVGAAGRGRAATGSRAARIGGGGG